MAEGFFSRAAGQKRREALEQGLMNYVPPELRGWLGVASMMNPVTDMEQAGQKARIVASPDATGQERFNAGVGMLTDMATVVAPAYGASKVGMEGAAGLVDSLTGIGMPARQGMQDAGRRFAVDESGAINVDAIKARFPNVDLSVSGTPERGYTLNKIVVPADQRGQGVGSDVMREVLRQADADGASVALTPSKDFGGSVSRLREFYDQFGFVQNKGKNRDFGISEDMYRLPQQPQTKADEIARMLREGRAGDVTDDMMGALGPNDQMRLFKLYEDGATGVPMPMDEASRMARAADMGFDTATPLYHGTTHNFPAFGGGNTRNYEGHFGAGDYFTDSALDASRNYAGEGPDLTARIQQRAEAMADDMGLDYDDPKVISAARQALKGENDGLIIPATIRGNTVNVMPHTRGQPTSLEINMPGAGDFEKDAWAELGADADKWDVWDRAQEMADEAAADVEPSGSLWDFASSIQRQGDEYGFDGGEAITPIQDYMADGVASAYDIDRAMRNSEGLMYAEGPNGELLGNEVLRQAFKDAGFDNIRMSANAQGWNMEIPEGTSHVISNTPQNIRSRFARFDPRLKHLANLSAGVGGVAYLGNQGEDQKAAQIRAYLEGL